MRQIAVLLLLGSLAAAPGCASGTDPDGGSMDGGPGSDSGAGMDSGAAEDADIGDAGPRRDGGGTDGSTEFCSAGTCAPFQYCDEGACRDYPACRGDGTCDLPGDVCHNRYCVPGDVDVDGDGSVAADDCDETDPDIHPGAEEICNDTDDDCDGETDEDDPTAMCLFYPGGGICLDGSCGCPTGRFDLDPVEPGCECLALPALDQGNTCLDAIDVGPISDTGESQTRRGNVLPDDREVWYHFQGVDASDVAAGGDDYYVNVHFNENPDNTFEFTVLRGSCGNTPQCADVGFDSYSWSADFRQTIDGVLTGHDPCTSGTSTDGISNCESYTTDYYVRVRRTAGSAISCAEYEIDFNNGLLTGAPPP